MTLHRRHFIQSASLLGASLTSLPAWTQGAPALITRDSQRPQMPHGVQSGDATADTAVVWTRADRPARMWVEWAPTASFANAQRVRGPFLLPTSDFTGRVDLSGLPAGQDIFYRVVLQDLRNERTLSEPMSGHLRLAQPWHASKLRPLRLVWSGDTAGQGFGINPEWGGMKIYEQMRAVNPDFFIHNGDTIYADGPIPAEVKLPDGQVWRNVTTPETLKVAETLDEFRGRYRYNLMDAHVRRFSSEVAQIWQWDDHEVTNNWSDSKSLLEDPRYTEKNVPLLVGRATRAFLDYAPLRPHHAGESERIYRHIPQGPLADVFVIDMRSYRGPNTANMQTSESADTEFLGRQQVDWLIAGLKQSKAVWKIIAADMPIGLQVGDGKTAEGLNRWEAVANGDDGPAKGRELEIARLLRAIKQAGVKNVVWLTADVHYTAAHYYDPRKARFSDFDGFWEFVSGPLNAGSFGPNKPDATFGLQVVWEKGPAEQNTSPFAGLQFFGQVDIDPKTRAMTVALKDLTGATLYSKELAPA
ncbi:alkaline phosphatase D family protein [Ottowia sp.]|uniref:alkaline phosphatase D family protein n=1 Tax=Ottowia sp. TaxID=1898956 RepID=UPI002C9ED00E|nr:alkaline phosphatase D family protein [Ottowia sp.]HOB65321.1 alkaline phosphatase D family protein [Ottowia sp.]HPZ57719.1 alkaline phosphatase D family protein [Ottowia sp.]HQD47217.1 alkaline phosphatase D family protein [Ottowia sp.]